MGIPESAKVLLVFGGSSGARTINRMVQEANAYQNSLKAKASAEISVFEKVLAEYEKTPELVWNRIYLEALEEIINNVGKIDFVAPETRIILSNDARLPENQEEKRE